MTTLVPNRFLFEFEFPLRYRPAKSAPKLDGRLAGWTDAERVPSLSEVDGQKEFADVWACWNEGGLYLAVRVEGRKRGLRCDPQKFREGDNIRLCIDTRDARTNRRATRTCHQFYILPAGGGADGRKAAIGTSPFQRAREDAPAVDESLLVAASTVSKTGYIVEAHIPARCLTGFDPAEHPKLGFYYLVEDLDLGEQYLTVGDDLYWYVDPSTWATAVLTRD
jgi:hypothetical protein